MLGSISIDHANVHPYGRGMKKPDRVAVKSMVLCLALASSRPLWGGQNAIQKQLDRVDWQPTWTVGGAQYVGREACAQCHPDIVATQKAGAMAHALAAPADSRVLQLHTRLTSSNGPYRYTIERNGNGISFTVADGTSTISVPVSWAFGYGIGAVGQTYLLSYKGSYYEGRVSFFDAAQGLDITLGHPATVPRSLEDALGRLVKPDELRACFGCHSTGAVSDGRLQIDKLVPGISCEGCHGPGAEHMAAVKAGQLREPHIFNPATLSPKDLVRFCGSCHRTRAHVQALQLKGSLTVRFQPYRLTESLCFNPRDRRISCLGCHDPHQNPQHGPAFYDPKCLACHGSSKQPEQATQHTAPSCPVAGSRCVTCHMPKYMLAGSHFRFTDHRVRVVRLGDTFD